MCHPRVLDKTLDSLLLIYAWKYRKNSRKWTLRREGTSQWRIYCAARDYLLYRLYLRFIFREFKTSIIEMFSKIRRFGIGSNINRGVRWRRLVNGISFALFAKLLAIRFINLSFRVSFHNSIGKRIFWKIRWCFFILY